MNPISSLIVILAMATALIGCASHPEQRPISVEEHYQRSLESLARQGLPYDEYVRQRAVLVRGHAAGTGRVAQARATTVPGRES